MFTSTYSNKQNAIARFATTSIASLLVSGAVILTTGCSDDSSSPAGAATDISKSDDGDATIAEGASVVRTQKHSGKSNDTWRSIRLIME